MKFPKTNPQPVGSPGNDGPRLAVSPPQQANRCLFSTSDARQCRMPRWEAHASLCLFHARQEQQLIDLDRVGAEFRSLPGEFKTAGGLNNALSKLLALVANNRIPPRSAATLAYIGQLLLRTLPGLKQEETLAARDAVAWEETARRAFPEPEKRNASR